MAKLTVSGYDFYIKYTPNFCEECANQAKKLEKVLRVSEDNVELENDSLTQTLQQAGEACLKFLYWVFGKEKIKDIFSDEVEITKLINFTTEACDKLTSALPKKDISNMKIKL